MRVVLCDINLTIDHRDQYTIFYNKLREILIEFGVDIRFVNRRNILEVIGELQKEYIIVFFNRRDQNYSDSFRRLLKKVAELKCKIWPIALTTDTRIPDEIVGEYQSFDVPVCLENRLLKYDNMETAAQICARKIISSAYPTFYAENKLLFVSHRRIDGEEIAAKLCDKINELAKDKKHFEM